MMMTIQQVGFIGLGKMGKSMALNVLKKNQTLAVYDINQSVMNELSTAGAIAYSSPREMASECHLIFLCLPTPEIVEAVLFADDGLAAATSKELVVIDTSTLSQEYVIELSAQCKAHKIKYVDCPVSGLPVRANDGTLTTMFGGEKAIYHRAEDLIKCFSKTPIYCGQVGSGQAMKTVNNIIYNINIAALSELLPFALASGLNEDALQQLVTSGSSRSFASEYFVPKMLANEFTDDFTLADAYKDITNIQTMANALNTTLPLTAAMTAHYEAAMDAGYALESKSAMLKVNESKLNVQFRHTK